MSDLVTFYTVGSKEKGFSLFMPLKYVYPECMILIQGEEKLFPLRCLQDSCHRSQDCPTKLAKRINFIFQHVAPDAQMIYAYFKHPDRPGSIRAGVFDRDLNEPKVMVVNRTGWAKYRREGIIQQWNPPMGYWLVGGSDKLIPVENLIKI